MAGVEAVATVSCVAGLIGTLDVGCRIVKQIKERRADRTFFAFHAFNYLEGTIKDARNSIQESVDKGNERFGLIFEAGDQTAQIAIMRITIEMQDVLLHRLIQAGDDEARDDGDLVGECIDVSKQGCLFKALMVLWELYQRGLKETLLDPRFDESATELRQLMHMCISIFERNNSRLLCRLLQPESGEHARTRNRIQAIYYPTRIPSAEIPRPVHGSQIFSHSLEADRASIYTIDTVASRTDALDFQADQASIYHSEVNMFSIHCASDVRLAPKDSDAASQISTRRIRPDCDQAMYETRPSVDFHRIRV